MTIDTSCCICGITGHFCGYWNAGPKKKNFCVSCGETEVEVFSITIPGEAGFFEESMDEALNALRSLVGEMDVDDDPYTIKKVNMPRLLLEKLPEFTGF